MESLNKIGLKICHQKNLSDPELLLLNRSMNFAFDCNKMIIPHILTEVKPAICKLYPSVRHRFRSKITNVLLKIKTGTFHLPADAVDLFFKILLELLQKLIKAAS